MPRNPSPRRRLRGTSVALAACAAFSAQAFEFDTGTPDLKLRLDTTVKYSAAYRLKDASPGLARTTFGPTGVVGANNGNQDDGDNNFGKGLVSNRVDLFSELDLTAGRFGARVSAAAWYDAVYNRGNDNPGVSANRTPANQFHPDTRRLMGRHAEVLDAFVFTRFELADKPVTLRLGRHTLLWGESLFFGANGIAGGMAPLDLIKLLSVPNATFKEVARPTGKLSGQMQLTDTVSVAAYVPYEWKATRLMPVGAYLSTSDTLGPGAERINAGPTGTFVRQPDLVPRDSGQGGAMLRWRAEALDADFGFYAIRYHATTPSNIVNTLSGFPPAGLRAQSYRWMYHEGVRAFGLSMAKTIDEWGFAAEASLRQNTPLASSGQSAIPAIGVGTTLNNRNNPAYAVGETAHLQLSWIASLGPSFVSREASFVGEVAWNSRRKVTRNAQMLNPNADKSASAMRLVYTPSYRQVLPGLDLSPSLGLGYAWGKSSAVGPGFGVDEGGDVSLGLGAVYLGSWNVNLNAVRYLGPLGPTLDNTNNAQFKQALKDRNFVSLSVRTTF